MSDGAFQKKNIQNHPQIYPKSCWSVPKLCRISWTTCLEILNRKGFQNSWDKWMELARVDESILSIHSPTNRSIHPSSGYLVNV